VVVVVAVGNIERSTKTEETHTRRNHHPNAGVENAVKEKKEWGRQEEKETFSLGNLFFFPHGVCVCVFFFLRNTKHNA